MNILLLSYDYPPQSGGIAEVSYAAANQLSRMGEKIIVVAERTKGGREFDQNNNFPTYRCIDKFILRELALMLLLPRLVLKHKIDLIYVLVWTQGGVAAFLTCKLLNVPYALHAHGTEFVDYKRTALDRIKYSPFRRWYKRLILRNATRLIAVSGFTKNLLIKLGAEENKISLIYNGVDINRFKPGLKTGAIVSRYRLAGKKVLLTASRLKRYKGQDIVIRLMPRLLQKIPNIVYLITGSGDYGDTLKSLVKELNLEENVIFTGHVDNSSLPSYYNACDIFIMLTREMAESDEFEGFGLVFLEANSCSKPVIGARTGGIPDAIVDGKTGYLVNLDNAAEIENRIVSLLKDGALARRLGEAGRQRIVSEGLSWESMGKKICALLASEVSE